MNFNRPALIAAALLPSLALAQSRTLDFKTVSPGCPAHLQIQEKFENGQITEMVIRSGRMPEFGQTLHCRNLYGKPTAEWDQMNQHGYYLTCTLSGYSLAIVYDQARRDPSDYGFSETYLVERTPSGARAHWGRSRDARGRPIFCEYQL